MELADIDFPQKNLDNSLEVFSPLNFKDLLPEYEKIQNNQIPIYLSKSPNDIIILCLHGAGLSGASFTLLAEEVKTFATLATYDIQGHGHNKKDENHVNYTL